MRIITFKKLVPGTLMVPDTFNKFSIEHTFFQLFEEEFPFDSKIFSQYLSSTAVIVVDIENDVQRKEYFQTFYKKDVDYLNQLEEKEKHYKEILKLKANKYAKKVKEEQAKEKEQKVIHEHVTVIPQDKITGTIKNYFSQE